MSSRISPVPLGQGADEEVNGVLQISKDGFLDTQMFGVIARVPALIKAMTRRCLASSPACPH